MKNKINLQMQNISFVLIISLAVWLKTYLITRFSFDLKIESSTQELILFISPLAASLAFVGFALFATGEKRNYIALCINFLLTIVLVGNVMFYDFYSDFVTLPVLGQTSNFGQLGGSIIEILNYKIILAFADIIFFFILLKKKALVFQTGRVTHSARLLYFLLTIGVFFANLHLAEKERPELLTRSFDRVMLVKNLGLYTHQVYDLTLQVKAGSQKALADSSKLQETENYVKANESEPNPNMFGVAKGKNVIVVTLESLQTFLIGATVNGQEVTPFLNEFINESYYFDNFFHQTGQGKTSDSEFLIDTSLYPLNRGAVFFTHGNNDYTATPEILRQQGYFTSVFHANNATFWNRNIMYSALGYDRYYNELDYKITPETNLNWGLKDIEYFDQSVDILKTVDQPFYARFLTLTNHYPFTYDEDTKFIEPYNSDNGVFDRYIVTARYLDESIKKFIERLKAEGMYDDSIIVLYGDHYGISEKHNRAMAQFLEKDQITEFDTLNLQRTPLYIHVPGQTEGQTISKPTGQIDMKPTILNLLGIDTTNDIRFGHDVFSDEYTGFVVLRDGSFITDKYAYKNNTFYDRITGEIVDLPKKEAQALINRAQNELRMSDKIIEGDLLRFSESNKIKTGEVQTKIKETEK
ncbi:LTA synthase family protein [Bacillus tropicus]|uniref:LTA synthase family protein n=1 Tax=Bacillus cereus group TaxID=86661 RepID=UPI0001A01D20|nr:MULTISPECIES: LTA synthase family protein [Bacillus cereus group]AJH72678.1 type I phosphodiesterase / nucleotide pyrophosphatase family protein [Bacillus cereus ATCC 4342]EEK82819.1 Sulfatase [Bacillus cereus ATCC 4342]KAA0805340.1 LTA synthase family protein [Bacillus sp. JAS102]KFM86837.1 type I phosphodiesterase / nucleotide pyrophosphatase family protein [Bacillus cereus ATCC 4342]MDR4454698.1 LTA synthase family protein [Bacillus tropicus]